MSEMEVVTSEVGAKPPVSAPSPCPPTAIAPATDALPFWKEPTALSVVGTIAAAFLWCLIGMALLSNGTLSPPWWIGIMAALVSLGLGIGLVFDKRAERTRQAATNAVTEAETNPQPVTQNKASD